jgi:hypothetical protein
MLEAAEGIGTLRSAGGCGWAKRKYFSEARKYNTKRKLYKTNSQDQRNIKEVRQLLSCGGLAINGNPISTGPCFSPPELDALSFCLLTAPMIEHHHPLPTQSPTPHSSSLFLAVSFFSNFTHI